MSEQPPFDFTRVQQPQPPTQGRHAAAEDTVSTYEQADSQSNGGGYNARHAANGLSTAQVQQLQESFREAANTATIDAGNVTADQRPTDTEHASNRWGALGRTYHKVADQARITIPEGYEGNQGRITSPIPLSLGRTALAKLNGGLLARDVWGPLVHGAAYDPVQHNPVLRKVYMQGIATQRNRESNRREYDRVGSRNPADYRQPAR